MLQAGDLEIRMNHHVHQILLFLEPRLEVFRGGKLVSLSNL